MDKPHSSSAARSRYGMERSCGASGSIAAMFAAYATLNPRAQIGLFFVIPTPAAAAVSVGIPSPHNKSQLMSRLMKLLHTQPHVAPHASGRPVCVV